MLPAALTLTIVLALATTSAWGQGGPPLETDDPGTPGSGRWELNTAVTLQHTPGGTLYEAPLADFNYGAGERIQLTLEVPLELERSGGTRVGLGHPELAVKWRFFEDTSSGLAVSMFPRVEFRSPIFSRRDPENGKGSVLLPIEMIKSWGVLGLNAEAGYRVVEEGPNEIIYRLALGYPPTNRLELLSECTGSSTEGGGSRELICQLGAREDIEPAFTLMGAIGTRVAGNPADRTQLLVYLGLQSRW
jgi:hypothetical protein